MRIAYNPKSVEPLKVAPTGDYLNAITFDLAGHNIFTRGEMFKGTDTTYEVFKKHTTSGNKGGSDGLVPVPSYTTTNDRFLREDGIWAAPSDVSNYTTHLYIGDKSSNGNNNNSSATSNGNTYLKLFDDNILRHLYLIRGIGSVTVSSDSDGTIIIGSESNNFYRPIAINGTSILGNDNNAFNLILQGAVVLTPLIDSGSNYTGEVQISVSEATHTTSGLLSAEDKKKLDGMTFTPGDDFSGTLADAFTTFKVGNNSIIATAGKQTATFTAGSGITLSLDTTNYALSIAGKTMTGASSSKNGTLGFVPAPAKGKEIAYLRGDGTWTNLSTDQVLTLNGYTIATNEETLNTSDSLNIALGKLEFKANKGIEAHNIITAAYDGDGTIENLNEILKVLEGISDTDTILAIINKYLPLTGGTITGNLTVNGTTTLSTTNINSTLTVKGNIVPYATNTYTLGTSSKTWKNIYSGLGTFSDNITAKGFIKTDSSNSKVLLGGGGDKNISDFLLKSEELTNNLNTIKKTLAVTKNWLDTGISGTDLTTGTYIVQVTVNGGNMSECIWSGTMSWYSGTCSDTEIDEILLHRSGKAYSDTIYLRTIMQNSGVLKLLIAADDDLSASYEYTFKFKRMI